MNIPFQIGIQFHEVLITLLTCFLLFVLAVYLTEKIKIGMNKKAAIFGSPEVCGACNAMIESRKIPYIENEQKILRAPDGVLVKLDHSVTELTTTTASLEKRVEKLFTMIEGDWQEQIKSLKIKLSEKDEQIRRLENKG
jgi:hypothetical protein